MFRHGKVLKVKVELSPEVVGFGRATIVQSEGSRLFLQLKTAKGEKRTLPKGTRVWFVSDSIENPFNGLWSTTVLGSRMIGGKPALECGRPKFEAVMQRRQHKRLVMVAPVRLQGEKYEQLQASTRNLSHSGVGIEVAEDCSEIFPAGHYVDFIIDSAAGPVNLTARVINSRFNWLGNRTEIGLEFVNVTAEAAATIKRLLASEEARPRLAPEGKEKVLAPQGSGQLSTWLKSTRDNVNFVKNVELQAGTSVLSAEDLEELDSDEDESKQERG